MKHFLGFVIVLCLGSLAAQSQVAIVNPHQLEVPPGKPDAIYAAALLVVSENFQQEASELSFPVSLYLGEGDNEHYVADEDRHIYAIYLKVWDEKKFAVSMVRLALDHLVNQDCRNQLVGEILGRADAIAPVSVRTRSKQ